MQIKITYMVERDTDFESVLGQSFTELEQSILISLLEHESLSKSELRYTTRFVTINELICCSQDTRFQEIIESLQEQDIITVTESNTLFSFIYSNSIVSLTSTGKSVAKQITKELILTDTIKYTDVNYTFSDEFKYKLLSHKI